MNGCDDPPPVTCNPTSGSTFPKGVTTVTCSASDLAMPPNTATCMFTVTVTDNVAPVLSGCTNVNVFTASNSCDAVVNYATPTASDNCDGSRPVTCNPPTGTTFVKGVTTVSCSASDLAVPPNTGTCTFTVTVTDNVAPVLSGCTNVNAFTATNACSAAVSFAPTANDNCDGSRTVTCNPPTGSTFVKGVTTVSCSASDLAVPPNTGTCTFTVTVTDNVAPVLTAARTSTPSPRRTLATRSSTTRRRLLTTTATARVR